MQIQHTAVDRINAHEELLFPLKRAFFPLIGKSGGQNAQEDHHRPEAHHADVLKSNGPWEQERDLKIEDDE